MNLHSPEKRLAALISVFDDDLSLRDAARLHGINKNSIGAWVKHGRGAMDVLRAQGVTPSAPVIPLVARPLQRGRTVGLKIARQKAGRPPKVLCAVVDGRSTSGARRVQLVKAAGVCVDCETQPSLPGRSRCSECLEYQKNLARERAANLLAAGCCVQCGEPTADATGTWRCDSCRTHRGLRHKPEKRIAVLRAVLEQNFTSRQAAAHFDVNKDTVSSWVRSHRNGSVTLESLQELAKATRQPTTTVDATVRSVALPGDYAAELLGIKIRCDTLDDLQKFLALVANASQLPARVERPRLSPAPSVELIGEDEPLDDDALARGMAAIERLRRELGEPNKTAEETPAIDPLQADDTASSRKNDNASVLLGASFQEKSPQPQAVADQRGRRRQTCPKQPVAASDDNNETLVSTPTAPAHVSLSDDGDYMFLPELAKLVGRTPSYVYNKAGERLRALMVKTRIPSKGNFLRSVWRRGPELDVEIERLKSLKTYKPLSPPKLTPPSGLILVAGLARLAGRTEAAMSSYIHGRNGARLHGMRIRIKTGNRGGWSWAWRQGPELDAEIEKLRAFKAMSRSPTPAANAEADEDLPGIEEIEEEINTLPEDFASHFHPVLPPRQPVPLPNTSGMHYRDRQCAWVRAARQGNELAVKLLLDDTDKFIWKMVRRYQWLWRNDVDAEEHLADMHSYTRLILFRLALPKFDPDRGFTWLTYAAWWIRSACTRWLCDQFETIRIPVGLVDAKTTVYIFKKKFEEKHGRAPTDEEIVASGKITRKKLETLKTLPAVTRSLNDTVRDGRIREDEREVGTMIADTAPSVEDLLSKANERASVKKIINKCLSSKERSIIEKRFGINCESEQTLEEIGACFSLSRERIRQIESRALKKLRAYLSRKNEIE